MSSIGVINLHNTTATKPAYGTHLNRFDRLNCRGCEIFTGIRLAPIQWKSWVCVCRECMTHYGLPRVYRAQSTDSAPTAEIHIRLDPYLACGLSTEDAAMEDAAMSGLAASVEGLLSVFIVLMGLAELS